MPAATTKVLHATIRPPASTRHSVDAWVNLAWVLALAGHARQAEQAARHAIDVAPENADGAQ